ncbi:MAG: 16S rRNA (guanine(527)-N(7))-methyltransferase RsmG [Succinivibrio sp.]
MVQKQQTVDSSLIYQKISDLLKETEIKYDDEKIQKMTDLVVMLCKWNKAYNLTAIDDPMKMVVLHILDSAVISPLIQDVGNNLADVGTGAGFPGLVLAILNPDKKFTLIDSIAKKLSFVKFASTSLNLKNVEIIHSRCEDISLENKFECILSRAFAPLEKIVNWCGDLISREGIFIAMKANLDQKEINDLPAHAKIIKKVDLKVPGLDAVRQAVFIKIDE